MSSSGSPQKRYGGSIKVTRKNFDSASGDVPSGFNSVLKNPSKAINLTNKIGQERFTAKKNYYGDVDIGNKIIGKDSDLEGFSDTLQKVKKEDVAVQPGAMRKHKMVKQLSGKFSKEDLKSEALERLRKERAEKSSLKPGSSSTLKSSIHSKGSFHGRNSNHRERPKINILALVDDAIEDGATEEAKEKLATEKALATAPPLPKKKIIKVFKRSDCNTAATETEKAEQELKGSKEVKEIPEDSKTEDPPKPRSVRLLSKVDKVIDSGNPSTGLPSLFGSTAKASTGAPPAWRAKLKTQGNKLPDSNLSQQPSQLPTKQTSLRSIHANPSPPSPALPVPKSPVKTMSPSKGFQRVSPNGARSTPPKASPMIARRHGRNSPESQRSPLAPARPPLVSTPLFVGSMPVAAASDDDVYISDADSNTSSVVENVPSAAPAQAKKIEKPSPLRAINKKVLDYDTDEDSGDEVDVKPTYSSQKKTSSTGPTASIQKKTTSISSPSDITTDIASVLVSGLSGQSRGDTTLDRLREALEEVSKKAENVAMRAKQELDDMKKEHAMEKETLRLSFLKDIHSHKKVNDKQDKEHQKMVDQEQQNIEELRSANQKLRATMDKLPKQMAEVMSSNQSFEKANEDIAGHFDELYNFSQKLQADQDRLKESSAKCKDEFLPRYRQELWERQQFLNAETKIKNLYRDCMIKIANKIERTSQSDLIEEVAIMVVETEGDINPKFDPKLLFSKSDTKSCNDSDSDSNDSNNDSGSDSDSDSD